MVDVRIFKPQVANVVTMSVSLKVRDDFNASFTSDKNETLFTYDGYVPDFMPGQHYGDYVELDIDLETGQIKNWNEVSKEDMIKWLEERIREENE